MSCCVAMSQRTMWTPWMWSQVSREAETGEHKNKGPMYKCTPDAGEGFNPGFCVCGAIDSKSLSQM